MTNYAADVLIAVSNILRFLVAGVVWLCHTFIDGCRIEVS